MKKFVALILLACAAPALAAPPPGFEARAEAVREAAGVPGMTIAIVEDGKTTLAEGFGVRKLGAPTKVDGDTIFMTGSTGKAFTSAALATLVDAGKLGWDDRVVDRLPGFQMYDPYVTREMTVRDLLVHRSGLGLGAGDLMTVPRGSLSRAEIVRRLRFIKPATSFRSGYAYDNILYIVAGQLIEAVTGQTWEDYVREHVFKPAGMLHSTADPKYRFATVNRAYPHARTSGAVRGLGELATLREDDQLSQAGAPAGLLAISANDMAKWLKLQLAHGKLPGGGQLFSEAQSAEMWKPQTIEPIAPAAPGFEGAQPSYRLYALGWDVRDYAGTQIIQHSGAVFGFLTAVVLIPEKNVGVFVSINSEDGQVPAGLMYELLDHYLGRPNQHWPERYAEFRQKRMEAAAATVQTAAATPAPAGPSLLLARYAATYSDPWYGDIVVGSDAKGLTIDFTNTPRMTGRLEHWQYDTFVARFDDKGIEPAYMTFALDADGKIARATMKPVSPTADFSFDYQDLMLTPKTPAAVPAAAD